MKNLGILGLAICFAAWLSACIGAERSDSRIDIEEAVSEFTIIKNGTLLTMNDQKEIIPNGVVVINGSDIIAVGSEDTLSQYPTAKIIDAEQGIIMPGMINLHNHLSMVAFRGLAEVDIVDFNDRLFNYFFKLESNLLDRNLIRISARHAAIEMARGGVTTTTDMYYHEDEVAAAVKEVGMRGVLAQSVIGFPTVDSTEAYGGLDYAESYFEAWKNDPLITPAIAPHAPYTVSAEMLRASSELSLKHGVPILIHMAELSTEGDQTDAEFPGSVKDQTVVEYLDSLDFLTPNLLAAHVNYVSVTDIATLKARGVGVAHNPKANSKDMSGTSPAWEMYEAGLDIGLGTDGPMSSNQMDILNVMPFASRVARIKDFNIARYEPFDLVYMATMGGARALDMQDKIGSIEPGKKADIVILETKSANMQPNYNPYSTLVYSAYPGNVMLTMVNGKEVYRDGEIIQIQLEDHQTEWNKILETVSNFAETLD